MPTPPVPPPPSQAAYTLDADEQALYDRMLRALGAVKADAYKATLLSRKAQAPSFTPAVPFNLNVRQSQVTPAAPTVPVQGPLGTQIRVPQSSLEQLALLRPSKEVLRADTLKAAGKYRDNRIVELLSQGKTRTEADWTANKEAYEMVRQPKSTSGFDTKAVGGYSTLALSGKDTLPFRTGMQTAAEAYKPQALETEEAAKGRRVFDALQTKAKAQLTADAKRLGQTEAVVFSQMFADNKRDAPIVAEQMYGPVDTSIPNGYAMRQEQIAEILAAKNAVLYAIQPDVGFFDLGKFASTKAGDAIKFMTEDEKYGVRTETKGVATLRFLGGLSRFGLNAIEASVIKPLAKATAAALDPNITYDDLTKIDEDAVASAGVVDRPGYSPAGNRVQLPESAKLRQKVDTGDLARDTMWDIATGRSAVDDYLDVGMDSGLATVFGLASEFAIPITPIGWVSDVAPALRVGAGLAAAGRGAGAAFDAAAATKAGQAVGRSRVGRFAGDVVKGAKLIPDAPQIFKIRAYAKANIKEGSDIGKSLEESPKFKDSLTDAASLRENLIEIISKEAGDVAQLQKTLQNDIPVPKTELELFDEVYIVLSRGNIGPESSSISRSLVADYGLGGRVEKEMDAAAEEVYHQGIIRSRGTNRTPEETAEYWTQQEALSKAAKSKIAEIELPKIQAAVNAAEANLKNSNIDAARLALVEAETHAGLGSDLYPAQRWDLRNKVRAEIINAIPTDDWVFVTESLLVKKDVVKSKEFIEVVKTETASFPPGITPAAARARLEAAIKKSFTGPAEGKAFKGTELAEPLAFDAPRSVGEGTPIVNEFPRGGIERLQTPEARRLTVVEVVQDTSDTLRALASFIPGGGSPYVRKAAKTFQEAAKGRVSADVYRFMLKTKSELDALERAQMAAFAKIKDAKSTSVLSDAINARINTNNDNFTIYDNYDVPVNSVDAADVVIVNEMVRFFFDDANLRAALGDKYESIIEDVVGNNYAGVSTLDAYRQTVAALRKLHPQLEGVGIGKRVGFEQVNIDIGAVQWLQSAEAKAIFRKNVREGLPKTSLTGEEYSDAMKTAASRFGDDVQSVVENYIQKVGRPKLKEKLDKDIDKVAADFVYKGKRTDPDLSAFTELSDDLERAIYAKKVANQAPVIEAAKAAAAEEIAMLSSKNASPERIIEIKAEVKLQIDNEIASLRNGFEARVAERARRENPSKVWSPDSQLIDKIRAEVQLELDNEIASLQNDFKAKVAYRIRPGTSYNTPGPKELIDKIKAEVQLEINNKIASLRNEFKERVAKKVKKVENENIAAGSLPSAGSLSSADAAKAKAKLELDNEIASLRNSAKERVNKKVENENIAAGSLSSADAAKAKAKIELELDNEIDRLRNSAKERSKAAAQLAFTTILARAMKPSLDALQPVVNRMFAVSRFDENLAVERLSALVDLPLTPALGFALRSYFGSIDELKRMRGVLGENSTYGIRSVDDSNFAKFLQGVDEVTALASKNASVGLTAGTVGPNIRYHATNHVSAPLVMALTNPTFLLENAFQGAIASPLAAAGVPIKRFPFTRGATVASIERGLPDEVAFVSTTGVSYTNGQLAKMLNENYFGMTQNEYISAGAKLEDLAKEAGAGWKPKYVVTKMIDDGLRYLGAQGTGYWARFAEATDRLWRKQVYITGLANGQTHGQAVQAARDTFLDYGKIPAGVRQTVGKHMMFFSWAAMHKMEFLRSMLTRNGASNVVKAANAQRDAHREWGQWLYEDDTTKAKLWADYIGDFGGVPALDVGPDNVMISPLLTTFGPAFHSAVDLTGKVGGQVADAISGGGVYDQIKGSVKAVGGGIADTTGLLFKEYVDTAFDPIIAYMRDTKMLGGRGIADIVPAKSIAYHQAQGIEHFEEWMETTGIEVIPLDERRLGTETFNDMQYKFSNDAAKNRWAKWELAYTYMGVERLISDYHQSSIVTGLDLPPGMDRQRWSNTSISDVVKYYLFSGSKVKTTNDYEQFRQLMLQAQRDLKSDNVTKLLSESGK